MDRKFKFLVFILIIIASCSSKIEKCVKFSNSLKKNEEKIISSLSKVDWSNNLNIKNSDFPKSIEFYETGKDDKNKKYEVIGTDTLFFKEKIFYLPDGRIYRNQFDNELYTQYYYDSIGRLVYKKYHIKSIKGYTIDKIHRWVYNYKNEIKERYSYDLKNNLEVISEFGSFYKYRHLDEGILEIVEREMLDDTFSEYAYKTYDNTILYNANGEIIFFRNHDLDFSDNESDRVSEYKFDMSNRLISEKKYKLGFNYTHLYKYDDNLIKKIRIIGDGRDGFALTLRKTKDNLQVINSFHVPNDSSFFDMPKSKIPAKYHRETIENKFNDKKDLIEEKTIYEDKIVIHYYKYEYDNNGNWIKKTHSRQNFDKNNTPISSKKTYSIELRKIEYFEPNEIFYLKEIPIETNDEKERRLTFMNKLKSFNN
ncbi:hypothetical protein [Tenacibaculum sp. nBUS_03]|uniref:hypothetical protein n=1 Tax=Tenacibaculum sp. nBUS_03 TaxID=3395320 RepID=UPI003EBFD394